MKKSLFWGAATGILVGLTLVFFGLGSMLIMFLSNFVMMACLFFIPFFLSKGPSKYIIVSVLIAFGVELVMVFLLSIYDSYKMGSMYPGMPIIGIYIFLLLPIAFIAQIILGIVAYFIAKGREKREKAAQTAQNLLYEQEPLLEVGQQEIVIQPELTEQQAEPTEE